MTPLDRVRRECQRWACPSSRVGFAGGIRLGNIVETLASIHAANETRAGDYWIDLETGVRDDHDRFDLGMVDFLERVAPFVLPRVPS